MEEGPLSGKLNPNLSSSAGEEWRLVGDVSPIASFFSPAGLPLSPPSLEFYSLKSGCLPPLLSCSSSANILTSSPATIAAPSSSCLGSKIECCQFLLSSELPLFHGEFHLGQRLLKEGWGFFPCARDGCGGIADLQTSPSQRRKDGQDTADDLRKRDLREELEDRERRHFSSKDRSYDDRDRRKGSSVGYLEGSKIDTEERSERPTIKNVDADDSDVEAPSAEG